MDFKHVSVLLNETIDGLNINPDGIYVDGTLGGGGHSYEICKRLSDKGRLIGIDQDGEALEAARERLKEFEDKITLVRSNYCEIDTILKDLEIESRWNRIRFRSFFISVRQFGERFFIQVRRSS